MIDGIMYKQTGASYWSVSRIKVSELEWILPVETNGIGNWPLQLLWFAELHKLFGICLASNRRSSTIIAFLWLVFGTSIIWHSIVVSSSPIIGGEGFLCRNCNLEIDCLRHRCGILRATMAEPRHMNTRKLQMRGRCVRLRLLLQC